VPFIGSVFEARDRASRATLLKLVDVWLPHYPLNDGALRTKLLRGIALGLQDCDNQIVYLSVSAAIKLVATSVARSGVASADSEASRQLIHRLWSAWLNKPLRQLALRDTDEAVRQFVLLDALVGVVKSPPESLQPLPSAIKRGVLNLLVASLRVDPSRAIRLDALRAFVDIGACYDVRVIVREIMPALAHALVDADTQVRGAALDTLQWFAGHLQSLPAEETAKLDMDDRVGAPSFQFRPQARQSVLVGLAEPASQMHRMAGVAQQQQLDGQLAESFELALDREDDGDGDQDEEDEAAPFVELVDIIPSQEEEEEED
jgi:hypothetical protein